MILVTGSTGFIGEQLTRRLLQRDLPVRALIRKPQKAEAVFGPLLQRLDLVRGDLREPQSLARALDGVTQVYHCAARVTFQGPPERFRQANVAGTEHLMNACRAAGVKRVLLMSSVAAGGPAVRLPDGSLRARTEADPPQPLAGCPYGESKLAQERAALAYLAQGLEVVVVRPSAVFGPGDPDGVNTLARLVAQRRMPFYLGAPDTPVSVVYVGDVVAGSIRAMEQGASGRVYNLVGQPVTHRELLELVAQVSGGRAPRLAMPAGLLLGLAAAVAGVARVLRLRRAPVHPNDVRNWTAPWLISGERAQAELGLAPAEMREAWRSTLAWIAGLPGEHQAKV